MPAFEKRLQDVYTSQLGSEDAPKRREHVVWLLGAGFSKPLGGPLFSELISKSTERWIMCWLSSRGISPRASLTQVLANYEKGLAHHLWENAEECITLIDQARADKAASAVVSETLGIRPEVLGELHVNLSHFVACATAHYVERAFAAEQLPEAWIPYQQWAGLLTARDAIVSFNYDRVVEYLFAETGTKTTLVKLHGTVPVAQDLCGDIESAKGISSIAIPGPSKTTAREDPLVAKAWVDAQSLLAEANRLVVIGYSFPASDAFVRFVALWKCAAEHVDVVVGPGQPGEAITQMFKRCLPGVDVRNTRLLAQEFLAEGCARPRVGRFNHWVTY